MESEVNKGKMREKGKMQQVRELLRAGKSSGEIISMGFAPGTVYGEQRRFRHGKNNVIPIKAVFTDKFSKEMLENGADNPSVVKWSKFQEEIDALNFEIAGFERVQKENSDLQIRILSLEAELKLAKESGKSLQCPMTPNRNKAEQKIVYTEKIPDRPPFLI